MLLITFLLSNFLKRNRIPICEISKILFVAYFLDISAVADPDWSDLTIKKRLP